MSWRSMASEPDLLQIATIKMKGRYFTAEWLGNGQWIERGRDQYVDAFDVEAWVPIPEWTGEIKP